MSKRYDQSPSTLLFGVGILGAAIISLGLYIPILLIYLYDKKLKDRQVTRFFLQLGLLDVLVLFIHVFSGFMILAQYMTTTSTPDYVFSIMEGVYAGLYLGQVWSILTLSYQRVTVILLKEHSVFQSRTVNIGCYLSTLLILIGGPLSKLVDILRLNARSMNSDRQGNNVFWDLEAIIALETYKIIIAGVVSFVSILCHVGIFCFCQFKKDDAVEKSEVRATVESFLISIYLPFITLLTILLTGEDSYGDDKDNGEERDYLLYSILLLTNAYHVPVHLLMNRRLRSSLLYFFRQMSPKGEPTKPSTFVPLERRASSRRNTISVTHST